jgi:3'-phosphoadenosine 5'-phosphosulfate sulfotransferase (PAPS reductase)/FAD synthetase
MQSLPLEAKEIMSDQRIDAWFTHWYGEVYVSFSGGKDSTVLADLVARYCERYGYKLYLLFVNTGLEYPEIQKFVKEFAEWLRNKYNIEVQLDILRPEMRFDEVIKKYGYPVIGKEVAKKMVEAKGKPNGHSAQSFDPNSPKVQKYGARFDLSKWNFLFDAPFDISHMCCMVMKKKPSKKYEKETERKPIIGTLADESQARRTMWNMYGCNAFEKKRPTSQPLSFWTEQDILHYIKKYDIPYCSVYGDIVVKPPADVDKDQLNIIDYLGCYEEEDTLMTTGCDRTGCIFCMFGCHLEKEPNRFQRLKETHPRQYEYCIKGGETVDGKWQPSKEGLGLGKVLDFIGVKYE